MIKWLGIAIILSLYDITSTVLALNMGAIELNPLLVGIADNFWALLLVKLLGIGLILGLGFTMEKIYSLKNKQKQLKRIKENFTGWIAKISIGITEFTYSQNKPKLFLQIFSGISLIPVVNNSKVLLGMI